ncbi:HCP-like protein [Backusella circina FSU 941]|nr:HCP-like protein [Backusella circina FSU 941]
MADLLTKSQKRELAKRVGLDHYIKSDDTLDNNFFEYDLGEVIYASKHVEHRAPIASRCYESAAFHGNGEAYLKLGQMYETGDGVRKNIENAYFNYIQYAICGKKEAIGYVRKCYTTSTSFEDYFKKLFKSHINNGEQNEQGCQMIGFLYHHGYGVRKNHYRAIQWYEKAAEKGLRNAQRNLGILYQKSRTLQNKYEAGFRLFLKSACQDDPVAQYLVGLAFEFGRGVEQNTYEAFNWFERSAKNRNKDAQFRLAKFYREGKVIPGDEEKALQWYEYASVQKYKVAKVCIAQLYQTRSNSTQGQETAIKCYMEASKNGCVTAQLRLDVLNAELCGDAQIFKELARKALIGDPESQQTVGLQYENGSNFNSKNTNVAFKWYLRAAIAGRIESQYDVGTKYYNGQFTKKSLLKAVKWIMKAAKKGHSKAQCELGHFYQKGEGVKKNPWEAIKWYTFAMNNENDDGEYYLGRMYEEGEGVPKKISSAKDLYERAAKKGNVKAQYRLGYLYELEGNYQRAFEYYTVASKENFDAQVGLATLYKNGQGVDKDYEKAVELYLKAKDQSCKAKYQLACIYVDQESGYIDYLEAYSLFKSAWEMDYKEAFWIGSNESYYSSTEPKVQDIVKMYNAAAEEENGEAEYKLGLLYEQAVLVKQDYNKALLYYRKSSKRGNSNALARIASLYERGKGLTQDYEESIRYYSMAIQSNNIEACFGLAVFYYSGEHISPDYSKAFELFSKASDKEHAGAKHVFESLEPEYYTGSVNSQRAINMFIYKAKEGDIDLQFKLGKLYRSEKSKLYNPQKAKEWYEEAAINGHVLAQVEIGKMYAEGIGTTLNSIKAIKYFKEAIKNDNTEARYLLGCIYFDGEHGIPRDYLKAYQLFKEVQHHNKNAASILDIGNRNLNIDETTRLNSIEMHKAVAETNDIHVQYTLGYIFEHGIGVDANATEAAKYYGMAAKLGSADAQTCLGTLYKNGFGVPQNYFIAIKWYNTAINLGSHDAMLEMGKMYHKGLGVTKDIVLSSGYIHSAANLGNHRALYILGSSRFQEGNHIKSLHYFTSSWRAGGEDAILFIDQNYDYPLVADDHYRALVKLYVKVATRRTNVEAQSTLANIFLLGDITPQNYVEAFKYYRMAAKNEHRGSMDIIELRNLRPSDSRTMKIIAMLTEVSEKEGDDAEEAEFILGNAYRDGKGVEKDINKAIFYYKKASYNNHKGSQNALGFIYDNGLGGITSDIDASIKYHTKAAENGHIESQHHLLMFYSNKDNDGYYPNEYIHWLTILAESNRPGLQAKLGLLYSTGQTITADFNKAIHWLERATKNNDLTGTLTLAMIYHCSKEHQDFNEAYRLYKTIIINEGLTLSTHVAHAMRNIGLLYENGHGVDKNYEKALRYYTDSSAKGNIEANYNLGLLYYYGLGVPPNSTLALRYFQEVEKLFKNRSGSICVFINDQGEAYYKESKNVAGIDSYNYIFNIMETYPGII